MAEPITIDFSHSPTVHAAVMSEAFVIGAKGPVGSGKSVGGVAFVLKGMLTQEPSRDGIRRTRWGVVRNTTPELKSTTIKTFTDWVPEGGHGRVIYSSPITYRIQRAPVYDGHGNIIECGIDAEILFVALDKPRDVRKLLSLELTGAWGNEARELPKVIVDGLTERVGRYPSGKNGEPFATTSQIYLDTNSMDSDHWWHDTFESPPEEDDVIELPDGTVISVRWEHYNQPPAVLELEEMGGGRYRSIEPGYPGYEFDHKEVIASAGKVWGVNPDSENLPNLRPGYYHRQLKNKSLEHIQCYQQNKYVYVREGRPVIPQYIPSQHGADFGILKGVPIIIGVDAGGGTLNPAAVILQRTPMGGWLAQSEVIGDDIGMERFCDLIEFHLSDLYGGCEIKALWMDPAGEKRDEIYETKVVSYFRAHGWPARSAPTQDVSTRIDAIVRPCERLINGKPGLLVNKQRCPRLHKGLGGAWYRRKLQVAGSEKYSDTPDKNHPYSDVCEALGYGLCGGGEARVQKQTRSPSGQNAPGQTTASLDFNVF